MSNNCEGTLCASCGRTYILWGQHERRWGCQLPALAEEKQARRDLASDLRFKELQSRLGVEVATMHLHKCISITACVMAVQLAEKAAAHVIETVRSAAVAAAASNTVLGEEDIIAIGARSTAVLQELRNIDKVCEMHAPNALTPVARPLLAPAEASKKHFAFFSLVHAVADVLQNCPEDRAHCYKSSEEWRTGKFRLPQNSITDIVHAQRFRDSPASRPATPAELAGPRRVILAAQPWNDDATVSTPAALMLGRALACNAIPQKFGRALARSARLVSDGRTGERARTSHKSRARARVCATSRWSTDCFSPCDSVVG
jgi:hypothetical protein